MALDLIATKVYQYANRPEDYTCENICNLLNETHNNKH